MKYRLPTRDECRSIIKNSQEAFYYIETEVQGFKVEMYNYRLASLSDFVKFDALELRGLTFVYNPATEIWERHIALRKFYNLNQTEGYMYDDLINKKIINVADKRDGSMITFIKLPNGNIVAKTKMSFDSPQAKMAQIIYDSSIYLKKFIEKSKNMTPVFEITSPHNQIVLEYNKTELHLLQIRNTSTGEYSHAINLIARKFNIDCAEHFPPSYHNLDALIARKELQEGVEGWVITTEDGPYKIKTDWYFQLHGLVTEGTRENLLIKTILDKNIDDVLAQLQPGEKKDFMMKVEEQVNFRFNHLVVEFKELRRKYFQDFDENRKDWATKHSSDQMFKGVVQTLNTSFRDVEQVAEAKVKEHIEHVTRDLEKARRWLM